MAVNPKNPSTLLFWNDLANDEELKACSRAARGLWTTECLPKAAAQRGVVQIGLHPCLWNDDLPRLLANSGGGTAEEVLELLNELVNSGAASVDGAGRLYNRRMARASAISETRSRVGKAGAEATNAKRQTSGKRVGKAGSKQSGKGVGKQVGKTESAEAPLSGGTETVNGDHAAADARQNSGNDVSKGSGNHDSKIAPSSFFSLQSSGDVTTTETVSEGMVPQPAGSGADAPDLGLDLDPPSFLDRRVQVAFAAYVAAAERVGWSIPRKLERDRSVALKARLKECGGVEAWTAAMTRAERSSFLNGSKSPGEGHENWRPDIDFFLKPKRFRKLCEGGYDDPTPTARAATQPAPVTGRMAVLNNVRERFRREREPS